MHSLSAAAVGAARRSYRPPLERQRRPIVVVEDDDDIRETYRDVLEGEGYRVLTAANGREALDVLDGLHGAPCLVLLDLMMPVMDGWQFLRTLKKTDKLVSTPVVVVSAVPQDADGAVRVMRKPVDVDALLETIREYC
jgi:CheY-like chemotaxis protein